MCEAPLVHAAQSPHETSGMTVAGSPTAQSSTPSPIDATRPAISWPSTAGIVTRASIAPWRMWRSVPQIPV